MATPIPVNEATFSVDDLVRIVDGQLLSPCAAHSNGGNSIAGVCTDSRNVKPGNLFVALSGERFDGHEHLQKAIDAGARALIVSKDVCVRGDVAVLRVSDTLKALGMLGREHRRRWAHDANQAKRSAKVVAVTGSAGKTTTCRAIRAVLGAINENSEAGGRVHASVGNLNNAIGIPMVLFGLGPQHEAAVIEIGTNSQGEIAYGASLAEPDVAVFTLVACAHTLGLGSIEAVAEEKGALLASLGSNGVCVANADDALVMSQVARSRGARVLTYGYAQEADVRVVECTQRGCEGQDLVIAVRDGDRERVMRVRVPLLGAAGVYAAVASLAAAFGVYGPAMDWDGAIRGLGAMRAESGRLSPRVLSCGAVLIDDAYNANPASMRDSIDVAAKLAVEREMRLMLVLGEMRELGAHSEREHRKVGQQVGQVCPSVLVSVGSDARFIAEEASARGVVAVHKEDSESAVEPVLDAVGSGDVILVKGSRGIALEHVVRALEVWGEERAR